MSPLVLLEGEKRKNTPLLKGKKEEKATAAPQADQKEEGKGGATCSSISEKKGREPGKKKKNQGSRLAQKEKTDRKCANFYFLQENAGGRRNEKEKKKNKNGGGSNIAISGKGKEGESAKGKFRRKRKAGSGFLFQSRERKEGEGEGDHFYLDRWKKD